MLSRKFFNTPIVLTAIHSPVQRLTLPGDCIPLSPDHLITRLPDYLITRLPDICSTINPRALTSDRR